MVSLLDWILNLLTYNLSGPLSILSCLDSNGSLIICRGLKNVRKWPWPTFRYYLYIRWTDCCVCETWLFRIWIMSNVHSTMMFSRISFFGSKCFSGFYAIWIVSCILEVISTSNSKEQCHKQLAIAITNEATHLTVLLRIWSFNIITNTMTVHHFSL